MATLRETLENTLAADWDDLAAHMAYADYLSEQGDPRGELIQVQLALEDEKRPAAEKRRLKQREAKLLEAHLRGWLGDLAPDLIDHQNVPRWRRERGQVYRFNLARGWLDFLHIPNLSVACARALAHCPFARLLRGLVIEENHYQTSDYYEPGPDVPPDTPYPALYPLLHAPFLGNLRTFQLGEQVNESESHDEFNCNTAGEAVIGLISRMPRIEELRLFAHEIETEDLFTLESLTHLRFLQVYHLHEYALARLAANPAFGHLTHLLLHPGRIDWDDERSHIRLEHVEALAKSLYLKSLTHLQLRLSDMGDAGCEVLVRSGLLGRLRWLDLQHGIISDAGARTLAACPELTHLEMLNLSDNALTAEGIAALRATGVRLVAEGQHTPDSDEWMFQADIE